ncbi:GNAT family N-acetyltransferase [Terribacillus saccharophilus]|uniref:GNAT family N-acetyltransferase n=1 Tax=Terribacillus saccharophilus TaxID=361277 RepID=UPI0039828B44
MNLNQVIFREAKIQDLDRIVYLLSDDVLGSKRENYKQPLPDTYLDAFHSINSDPNNELIVACYGNDIIGVQQITFTPFITYQGGWRATIEGVRTAPIERGKGVGSEMIKWAIHRAKKRRCHLVQLTTDKNRPEALHFYEKLGFKPSHEGLKLHL